MTTKIYTSKVAGQLPELFASRSAFMRAFGGDLQVITGDEYDNKFLKLKTEDTEVVIQEYNTDPDVAFGEGTSKSSRLGPMREVKSTNEEVEFEAPLVINEGIDTYTANDDIDTVASKRLAIHANGWLAHYEKIMGKEISDKASKNLTVELTEESIVKAFNEAYAEFINNEVSDSVSWIAYVTPEVGSILADSKLTVKEKSSNANIGDNMVDKFKNFEIVVIPESKFQEGEVIYFTAENVGVAGVALKEARAMDDHPDFFGIVVQSAAKFGKFIPEKNTKAIIKATLSEDETPEG